MSKRRKQKEPQATLSDVLRKNGTLTIEAPTRDALAEKLNEIAADCKVCVGAVGRKADGSAYTLQINLI